LFCAAWCCCFRHYRQFCTRPAPPLPMFKQIINRVCDLLVNLYDVSNSSAEKIHQLLNVCQGSLLRLLVALYTIHRIRSTLIVSCFDSLDIMILAGQWTLAKSCRKSRSIDPKLPSQTSSISAAFPDLRFVIKSAEVL